MKSTVFDSDTQLVRSDLLSLIIVGMDLIL